MTAWFVPGLEEPALFITTQEGQESRLYDPAGNMTHRHLGPVGKHQ